MKLCGERAVLALGCEPDKSSKVYKKFTTENFGQWVRCFQIS